MAKIKQKHWQKGRKELAAEFCEFFCRLPIGQSSYMWDSCIRNPYHSNGLPNLRQKNRLKRSFTVEALLNSHTLCTESLDQMYVKSYYIELVKTSLTYRSYYPIPYYNFLEGLWCNFFSPLSFSVYLSFFLSRSIYLYIYIYDALSLCQFYCSLVFFFSLPFYIDISFPSLSLSKQRCILVRSLQALILAIRIIAFWLWHL